MHTTLADLEVPTAVFHHEALLYEGERGFMDGTLAFLHDAVELQAAVLVAVGASKITLLRDVLGDDAGRVSFVDMAELGRNPARIISAWRDFAAEHGEMGRPLRGIGEPVWAGRDEAELVECHRHEALLNLAFAHATDFHLLCPYDTAALAPAVVEEACRTHPHLRGGCGTWKSPVYPGLAPIAVPFDAPLPPSPAGVPELAFDAGTLGAVRMLVTRRADAAAIGSVRRDHLLVAVNELATNSVRHGGGHGTLRVWDDGDALVCEVRDSGRIADPLVGRKRPAAGGAAGYGLWLVHQLCDLAEVRTQPDGTVVRVRMWTR